MTEAVSEALAAIEEAVTALDAVEGSSPARLALLRSGKALARSRDGREDDEDGVLDTSLHSGFGAEFSNATPASQHMGLKLDHGNKGAQSEGSPNAVFQGDNAQRGLRSALKSDSKKPRWVPPTPVPFAPLTPAKRGSGGGNFDDDLGDLSDDDDNGRAPSPPPPPPLPPPHILGDENNKYELEQRLHEAQEEASRMKSFFEGVKKVNDELQASVHVLLDAKREHEKEIADLREKLERAQMQTQKARDEVQAAEGDRARSHNVTEFTQLRQEKETLEDLLTKVMDTREQEEREIAQLRAEVQSLRRSSGVINAAGGNTSSPRLVQLSASPSSASPSEDARFNSRFYNSRQNIYLPRSNDQVPTTPSNSEPQSSLKISTDQTDSTSQYYQLSQQRQQEQVLGTPSGLKPQSGYKIGIDSRDTTFATATPQRQEFSNPRPMTTPSYQSSRQQQQQQQHDDISQQSIFSDDTQVYVEKLRRDMTERRARTGRRRSDSLNSASSQPPLSTPKHAQQRNSGKPWDNRFTPGPLTIRKLDFATPSLASEHRADYDGHFELDDAESAMMSTSSTTTTKLRVDSKSGIVDIEMSPRNSSLNRSGGDGASAASGSVLWTNRTPLR